MTQFVASRCARIVGVTFSLSISINGIIEFWYICMQYAGYIRVIAVERLLKALSFGRNHLNPELHTTCRHTTQASLHATCRHTMHVNLDATCTQQHITSCLTALHLT
jgi:hypothetical protein